MANLPSIKIISADQGPLWHEHLAKAGCEDVYFSPEYALTFRTVEGGTSHLFIYEDGDGMFLYPFRLRGLPPLEQFEKFADWSDITSDYGYGGPVISVPKDYPDAQEFVRNAVRAFDRYCAEQRVVTEFCRFHPLVGNARDVKGEYGPILCNQTAWVDLSLSEDELWRRIRKGYRYDIRRAEKQGVEIETGDTPAHADAFFQLYHNTMKDVGARGYYYFNQDFFRDTLESLGGRGVVFLGRHQGKAIAGALFIWGKEFFHYYFAGMDRDFASFGANKLIQHRAMVWAKKRGFRKMHLGGGVGGSDADSLMLFKSGFSPLRAEFYIAKRVHDPEAYRAVCAAAGVNPDNESFFPAYRNIHRE